MIYKIIFKDGSVFTGGKDVFVTNWLNIPENKEIKELHYALPDSNIIVLRGYDAYNHLVEVSKEAFNNRKHVPIKSAVRTLNGVRVISVFLMGKKGNKVISYRIILEEYENSKYKIGDITRREKEFGKEFYGAPSTGWRGKL